MIAKSHLTNGGAKEKTCALVRVCAFDNACKTIVIAHVRACEFSKIPRCIVFDTWPHVVHQFPVQVLLFRSPWSNKYNEIARHYFLSDKQFIVLQI